MAEQIRARPRPSASYEKIHNKGPRWLHRTDPSDSWWENGALVVDDEGPALIDADSNRHPFPEAAAGGFLVHSTTTLVAGAPGTTELVALFVAAPPELGQRVLLVLPYEGFGEGVQGSTELIEFARAAGLRFTERSYISGAREKEFPGPLAKAPDLRWAIYDQAHRDRSLGARLWRAGARVGLGVGHRGKS